jgi:group I intron endonuclease
LNTKNWKGYVGKHNGTNPRYESSSELLPKAYKKHGKENFLRIIIQDNINDPTILNEREKYWIKELKTYAKKHKKTGYNLTEGGDGITFHTNDAKTKISKNRIYISPSDETRKKQSESLKRRYITNPEIRQKISKKLKGKNRPEEVKKKISQSQQGNDNSFFGKHHSEIVKKSISDKVVGENNPMYKRSVYSVWLGKYGVEEADRRKIAQYEKISKFWSLRRERKKEKC